MLAGITRPSRYPGSRPTGKLFRRSTGLNLAHIVARPSGNCRRNRQGDSLTGSAIAAMVSRAAAALAAACLGRGATRASASLLQGGHSLVLALVAALPLAGWPQLSAHARDWGAGQWGSDPRQVETRFSLLTLPDGTEARVLRLDCLSATTLMQRSGVELDVTRLGCMYTYTGFLRDRGATVPDESLRAEIHAGNEFERRDRKAALDKHLREMSAAMAGITYAAIPVLPRTREYDFGREAFPVDITGLRSSSIPHRDFAHQLIECFSQEVVSSREGPRERVACFRVSGWPRSGMMPVPRDFARQLRETNMRGMMMYLLVRLPEPLQFRPTVRSNPIKQQTLLIADVQPVALTAASVNDPTEIHFFTSIERASPAAAKAPGPATPVR